MFIMCQFDNARQHKQKQKITHIVTFNESYCDIWDDRFAI